MKFFAGLFKAEYQYLGNNNKGKCVWLLGASKLKKDNIETIIIVIVDTVPML